MFWSNALPRVVIDAGADGSDTDGAAGSVGLLRSRIGSVLVVWSACSVAWIPWLSPNTPVKSDMPGRWNAIAQPPRTTTSPSSLPRSHFIMPADGGTCHAAPTLGATLLRSGLYAYWPAA